MNGTSSILLAVIAALYALPALADNAVKSAGPTTLMEAITMGTPMTNFRLRYENVDQDGHPNLRVHLVVKIRITMATLNNT
jgi:hypothetical protein